MPGTDPPPSTYWLLYRRKASGIPAAREKQLVQSRHPFLFTEELQRALRMKSLVLPVACLAMLAAPAAFAETDGSVCSGAPLTGTVVDTTGAIIPGATVSLETGTRVTSGSDGHFRFPCVADGSHHLQITATSFANQTMAVQLPLHKALNAVLQPEAVETTVNVTEETAEVSPTSAGPTQTISGKRLQALADDPDELLQQLQQMAAASGGNPSNTTISVDGFQDSAHLPPKDSIAYIKVNPDLFSAEYREPPFDGGRVEVYTKPGAKAYHGALFGTDSFPWMNAQDPFSTSKGSIGRQRYGFELTGPITRQHSNFTLNLEHRSIDNVGVVNATTLDASGNPVQTVQTVATPQRRWLGQARMDWQLGPKNTFITSYSADVNHLTNVGVGGTTLLESGYDSGQYDHILRFTDVTTVSPKTMHEARVSLHWTGETDVPTSTAPQVSVAGAFTGGGATIGPQHIRYFAVEYDDDAIINTKSHLLKFGTQLFIRHENAALTTNFNGTYTFGGGLAPVLDGNNQPTGETATITGLEQYRRALLDLPGGTPTQFSNVAGTPGVDYVQVADALFFQDDWKVRSNVHLALGMRYAMQTNPTVLNGATPRFGVSWTPDKKATWNLHGHIGMFTGQYGISTENELRRMDGVQRITSSVYNPVYGDPFSGSPTVIESMRTTSPHLANISFYIDNIGFTKALPGGWNLSADAYDARIWNYSRSPNINSPFNGSPTGPRPGAPNLNIYQLNNSGQGGGNVEFMGLEQHKLKYLQLFVGAVRVEVFDDTNNDPFWSPQSSTSDAGEFARRSGNPLWNVFGNATAKLPEKLEWSFNMRSRGDAAYNVTTGFDNNGDGVFNDRPQYAPAGTPLCSANPNASPCGYTTPWGLLVPSGGQGVFSRNKGIMPWQFYLDTNLQRAFKLTRNDKAEHPQTLTVNIRSSNVLNHMNVTSVGGVLGSPNFGIPYAADNGRRVEFGLRYSF